MEDDNSDGDQSLIALATKLAQVQFRLRQLSRADEQTRELLLKDLERFAFDSQTDGLSYDTAADSEQGSRAYQQRKIIAQLKLQVDQLEREYAKSSSKQALQEQVSVNELRSQLGHHLASLVPSNDPQQETEDSAVGIPQLSPPPHTAKRAGGGVTRAPAQPPIRHVRFEISSSAILREDSPTGPASSRAPPPSNALEGRCSPVSGQGQAGEGQVSRQLYSLEDDDDTHQDKIKESFFKKSLVAMETTMWLCGSALGRMVTCSTTRALSPPVTETVQLRRDISRLEEVISELASTAASLSSPLLSAEQTVQLGSAYQQLVSQDLTAILGSLLEHGLDRAKCVPESVQRKGEFSVKMTGGLQGHWAVWKVFQEYYKIKGGDGHNSSPLHQLSSSFSLPVENGLPPKKALLTCIHKVERACQLLPASDQPRVKLDCLLILGYNIGYLKEWLHMLVSCEQLVDRFYHGYSFVVSAGFRPAFPQLDRLQKLSPRPVVESHLQEFTSDQFLCTS